MEAVKHVARLYNGGTSYMRMYGDSGSHQIYSCWLS